MTPRTRTAPTLTQALRAKAIDPSTPEAAWYIIPAAMRHAIIKIALREQELAGAR